jgi:quercetin dioxygenase-like cupin family protein
MTQALATLLLGSVTVALSGDNGTRAGWTSVASAASEPRVEYFDSASVRKAFTTGKPLLGGSDRRNIKVMGLRRQRAGEVEVHTSDTDIFYVVEGHATFVTGGTLTNGKHIAPDEIRGGTLSGGEIRHLDKGDVIIIPKGVPHWYKEVPESIEYFVVKVR